MLQLQLQLEEFEKIKGELSRCRLDDSLGVIRRIHKFFMNEEERWSADYDDYNYNMNYLFDQISLKFFKVRECNADELLKTAFMEYLINHNINIENYVRKIEIIQRNEPFHAYLEECMDGSLLYTIQGKSFIYTITVNIGSYYLDRHPITKKLIAYNPIKLHEILRRSDGDNFENYYEIDRFNNYEVL